MSDLVFLLIFSPSQGKSFSQTNKSTAKYKEKIQKSKQKHL
jgi:hypothetical protein